MSYRPQIEALSRLAGPSSFCSGRFASLYRYLFAVVSIVFAFNTYHCRLLLFDEIGISLTLAFVVWLVTGAIFLWHWPRFSVRAANYLSGTWLVLCSEGVFNVECKFFITMAFFNMGLRLRSDEGNQRLNCHVVYAMMLSFGAYLFYGGFLTKAQDEYWNSGSGLFHVMSLPWIAPEWVRSIMLAPVISEVANWGALTIEGVAFPLLLFRRTRAVGVIVFVSFAGFLAGCLRISTIGCEAVAVACLFLQTVRWRGSGKTVVATGEWSRNDRAVAAFYYSIVLIAIFMATASSVGATVRGAERYWNHINRLTVNLHYDILFTKAHFLSVEEYRVLLYDGNGLVREPVRVFSEDTLAGPESGGILTSRWLQAEMYRTDRDVLLAGTNVPSHVRRLVRYCLSQDDSGVPVDRVQVLVRQVSLPVVEKAWHPLIDYYPDSQRFEILQRMPNE